MTENEYEQIIPELGGASKKANRHARLSIVFSLVSFLALASSVLLFYLFAGLNPGACFSILLWPFLALTSVGLALSISDDLRHAHGNARMQSSIRQKVRLSYILGVVHLFLAAIVCLLIRNYLADMFASMDI